MQTRWWGLGAACALVVACSATTEADDGAGDAGPVGVSRDDSGDPSSPSDGGTLAPPADSEVPAEDASPEDSSAPDGGPQDAGRDSALPPDSGPPPPTCAVGAKRCNGIRAEECAGNQTWVHDLASQQVCCRVPTRFVVSGNDVTDQNTGRVYRRDRIRGDRNATIQACAAIGARLPTEDELFDIVIGAVERCAPTVDQTAFVDVFVGDLWTSGAGCVNFANGTTGSCGPTASGTVCAKN